MPAPEEDEVGESYPEENLTGESVYLNIDNEDYTEEAHVDTKHEPPEVKGEQYDEEEVDNTLDLEEQNVSLVYGDRESADLLQENEYEVEQMDIENMPRGETYITEHSQEEQDMAGNMEMEQESFLSQDNVEHHMFDNEEAEDHDNSEDLGIKQEELTEQMETEDEIAYIGEDYEDNQDQITEAAENVQNVTDMFELPEESFAKVITKPVNPKTKTAIISKDGELLELSPKGTTYKKFVTTGSFTKVSSPSKRPLLPVPEHTKGIITKYIMQGSTGSPNLNQSFKILSNPTSTMITSATRTLTVAQAQQMGLLSGGKLQQILPSGQKRMIVKKIIPSSSSNVLSPTKILPAPSPSARNTITNFRGVSMVRGVPVTTLKSATVGMTQIRPVTLPNRTSVAASVVNIKPSVAGGPQQRVIIRQAPIPVKAGTTTIYSPTTPVAGQVIRIPAGGNIQPIQFTNAKPLQYVRLVSNSPNLTTTKITNVKGKFVRSGNITLTSPTTKAKPIAPSPVSGVKPVLPKSPVAVSGKRLLIPVSQSNSPIRLSNTELVATDLPQIRGNTVQITLEQLKALTGGQFKQDNVVKVGGSIEITQVSNPNTMNNILSELEAEEEIEMLDDESKDENKIEFDEDDNFEKENVGSDRTRSVSPDNMLEANGIRMKKPCNCTRSQCLKLYCECFANSEFCNQCNCDNCFNNLEHEEDRQKSIKSCLERNPNAFKPKIQIGQSEEDERRHNKGCNCKRSGCLKNYCECFEAKITCTKYCKCVSCRNTEEFLDGSKTLSENADDTLGSDVVETTVRSTQPTTIPKQPYNFMSNDVIEATCQCLLAQSEDAVKNGLSKEASELMIIEEFGKCLVEIIKCSNVVESSG